jgi:hypothetical protein
MPLHLQVELYDILGGLISIVLLRVIRRQVIGETTNQVARSSGLGAPCLLI